MIIYAHSGMGNWYGSLTIVIAKDRASAEKIIRKTLDENGLKDEEINIIKVLPTLDEKGIMKEQLIFQDSGHE